MKRKILIGVALLFLVLGVIPGIFAAVRMHMAWPKGEVALTEDDTGMVCSTDAYHEFLPLMPQAGEVGLAQMPYDGTVAEQRDILARYAALGLNGSETVVTSLNLDDGQIYSHTCASEKCTMEEMGVTEDLCWQDTLNCTFLAIRFRGQDHCVLAPAKDSP